MQLKKGVQIAYKKDHTKYFRSSLTFHAKHISLGSFKSEDEAHFCYIEAYNLLNSTQMISDYNAKTSLLSFNKWVSLINFRDHLIYFKTPIYLFPNYFEYHYDENLCFKFDVDDLFFYAKHKIMKRQGHLFVADYGMQLNIVSRYGIKNYAVCGRDYLFVNGDNTDFRYKNIQIINRYNGVSKCVKNGRDIFIAKIHINGDYIIGRYSSESEAAIAYNKAAELLLKKNIISSYQKNYIESLSSIEYAKLYTNCSLSSSIRALLSKK